jgi:putative redox protein
MTAAPGESDANQWVTARIGAAGFHVDLSTRSYRLTSDEPSPLGGTDTGPTPYELLLSALGSCTAMTLRMYADRRGMPVESIEVRLRQARAHERDCEHCDTETVGVSHIERRITLTGALTDEMRSKLLEIADRCPVSQTITRGIPIETIM